jgi:diacylglycerol O-acyltransferase / wax synthase
MSGRLSEHRRFAFSRGSTGDIAAVRRALGGTFNDVVLSAVTAGFRALLLARGETPAAGMLRTLVPVSVRAPGEEGIRNNQVSLLLAMLPIDVTDPVRRLAVVRERLAELKASHEAEAGTALMALADAGPFPAVAAQARMLARLPQRSIVAVTTNVPGPREPLYALGRRLQEIIPYVPIASTVRTGVSILSYCDRVTFGVTGDYDSAADVEVLAHGIETGLAELTAAARRCSASGFEHVEGPTGRRRTALPAAGRHS